MAVEGVAGEDEATVDGDALALVDGEGVAVADVAGVEVPRREPEGGAVVGTDNKRARVEVDVGDGGEGAVADAEAAVVARHRTRSPRLEGEVADVEGGSGDRAVAGEVMAGPAVEVVDVVAAFGEHDDVVAGEGGGVPVGGHLVTHIDRGLGDDDAVVVVVAASAAVERPARRSASASRSQTCCWRRFSVSVTGGSRWARPLRRPPASMASSWRGSPTMTTFAPRVARGVEERRDAAGGGHRRFVDHEHRLSVELEGAVGELQGAERDGVGRDPGLGLELRGRGRGQRGADDVVAGAVPRVVRGVEAERLAGPGRGDDHIDPVPRGRDRRRRPRPVRVRALAERRARRADAVR